MTDEDLNGRLEFLRHAEQLKDTLRSAHTAQGRVESVAEHTWRLALFVMTFCDQLPELDHLKLMKLCVLHDLGEAIGGDIPAPLQTADNDKRDQERADFLFLLKPLPEPARSEFIALWDEYDLGESPEARVAKAFDKLETILQHTQGANPVDFDYEFNLGYGKAYTDQVPLAVAIREVLDGVTRQRAQEQSKSCK
ncbi:MAG: HD domain-containing protein [Pseudomonadota bacterium]